MVVVNNRYKNILQGFQTDSEILFCFYPVLVYDKI